MDILGMLSELRAERDQLEEAILTIERLARGQGKRRGRPPKWMAKTSTETPLNRKAFSAATRKKMAEAQKARWAAKKAG